jgi:hypothetical protein
VKRVVINPPSTWSCEWAIHVRAPLAQGRVTTLAFGDTLAEAIAALRAARRQWSR